MTGAQEGGREERGDGREERGEQEIL